MYLYYIKVSICDYGFDITKRTEEVISYDKDGYCKTLSYASQSERPSKLLDEYGIGCLKNEIPYIVAETIGADRVDEHIVKMKSMIIDELKERYVRTRNQIKALSNECDIDLG